MSMLRTPMSIDGAVLQLCRRVGSEQKPLYLMIDPEPDCEPLECFHNVRRKVEREGGRMQTGWAIWIWPKVFLEAEHHAVYEPPQGGPWQDLTPQPQPGFIRRLFLPDDAAGYDFQNEGVRRDNIRLALANDVLVARFFRAAERRTRILNEIPGIGMVTVSGRAASELEAVTMELGGLQAQLVLKYTGVNDPCFCGSGQKFKRCHGTRR